MGHHNGWTKIWREATVRWERYFRSCSTSSSTVGCSEQRCSNGSSRKSSLGGSRSSRRSRRSGEPVRAICRTCHTNQCHRRRYSAAVHQDGQGHKWDLDINNNGDSDVRHNGVCKFVAKRFAEHERNSRRELQGHANSNTGGTERGCWTNSALCHDCVRQLLRKGRTEHERHSRRELQGDGGRYKGINGGNDCKHPVLCPDRIH